MYADVFTRLATAEREAAGSAAAMPAFGDAATPWVAVSGFYAAWTAFSTAKDFAWADEYNPASAPNRKVRRLMEDDNRKRRAKARREFNETVRELAAFVRKRDKRVAAAAADAARVKAAREQEAAAQREAAKRERAARARAAKLAPHEFQGGSFSISNLGMFGVTSFSAIINPPQAAILAVGETVPDPVWPAGAEAVSFVDRLAVTLSFDARAVAAEDAAAWLDAFAAHLESPEGLVAGGGGGGVAAAAA